MRLKFIQINSTEILMNALLTLNTCFQAISTRHALKCRTVLHGVRLLVPVPVACVVSPSAHRAAWVQAPVKDVSSLAQATGRMESLR